MLVGKAISGIFLATLRHEARSSASYALRCCFTMGIPARQALQLVWDECHNALKTLSS
jgi:hypothetical protein